ncbi:MAG: hypothetical protein ABI806_30020, partial [Candidatus Solibacter sp.]
MGAIVNLVSPLAQYAPSGLQEAGRAQASAGTDEAPADAQFADLLAGLTEELKGLWCGSAQSEEVITGQIPAAQDEVPTLTVGHAAAKDTGESAAPAEESGETELPGSANSGRKITTPPEDDIPLIAATVTVPLIVPPANAPIQIQVPPIVLEVGSSDASAATWNPRLPVDPAPPRAAAASAAVFENDTSETAPANGNLPLLAESAPLPATAPPAQIAVELAPPLVAAAPPVTLPVPENGGDAGDSVVHNNAGVVSLPTTIGHADQPSDLPEAPHLHATDIQSEPTTPRVTAAIEIGAPAERATPNFVAVPPPASAESLLAEAAPAAASPLEIGTHNPAPRTADAPPRVTSTPPAFTAAPAPAPLAPCASTRVDDQLPPESSTPRPSLRAKPVTTKTSQTTEGKSELPDSPPQVPLADRPVTPPLEDPTVPAPAPRPPAPLQTDYTATMKPLAEPSARRGGTASLAPSPVRKSAASVMAQVLALSGQMPRSVEAVAPPNPLSVEPVGLPESTASTSAAAFMDRRAGDTAQRAVPQVRLVGAGTRDRGEVAFSVRMPAPGNQEESASNAPGQRDAMAAPSMGDSPLTETASGEGNVRATPLDETAAAPRQATARRELPATEAIEAPEAAPGTKAARRPDVPADPERNMARDSKDHRPAAAEHAPAPDAPQSALKVQNHTIVSTAPKVETVPARSETAEQIETKSPATLEPEAKLDTPKPGAVRDVKFEVTGDDRRVEVRLSERAGEVKLTVRTSDGPLAGTLRENLPELSAPRRIVV